MPYRILVVDDDAEFREELRECLSRYRVVEASSGEEALDIIRKPHAINLVLLDVFMPGLSGTEILKQIKQISPKLSIIILTGNSSKDVAVDALKGRADDYIEKPVDMDKFHKTIERVLAGSHGVGKMERAKNFLKDNYDKKVGLADISQELCLSPKYLSRIFKEKTGMGFSDYRLKIKMEMAGELLATTSLSVQELSDKLGYKNLESFVRMFKKMTGETPTGYRTGRKKKPRRAHARS